MAPTYRDHRRRCRALSARAVCTTLVCLAGMLLSAPAVASERGSTRVFALVIGNNAPHKAGAPRLQYADDDAAAMHELFSRLPGRSRLFAELDAQTRRRWPELNAEAIEVASIRRAVAELSEAMHQARGAGHRAEFYFFYSGHGDRSAAKAGDPEPARSYLNFGARFDSRDLFELLKGLPADAIHVLVDACRAVELVAGRGEEADAEAQAESLVVDLVDARALYQQPRVGVLVASTPTRETLEWNRLGHGVFSYTIRSGLLGGADLDGDRRISYAELSVFAAHAFGAIDDPSQRLAVRSEPPRADPSAPFLDLREASVDHSLVVPEGDFGRLEIGRLRDDVLSPYATVHLGREMRAELLLLGGDSFRVTRRDAQGCRGYPEDLIVRGSPTSRRFVLSRAPKQAAACPRGIERLFAAPVTAITRNVFLQSRPDPLPRDTPAPLVAVATTSPEPAAGRVMPDERMWPPPLMRRDPWPLWASLATGAGALAFAAAAGVAWSDRDRAEDRAFADAPQVDRSALREARIHGERRDIYLGLSSAFLAATLGLVSYGLWWQPAEPVPTVP